MIFRLRYLPPVLGVIGAIAGMAIVSGILPKQGKAWVPFADSLLTADRLQRLNQLKVSETRYAEGVEVSIAPQSGMAMHSLTGLGSPNEISPDGSQEAYYVARTAETSRNGEMIFAGARVIVTFEANDTTGYVLKATRVWVPIAIIANR